MKRLRRIIFNAVTALSLVLCAATAVLWVRSATTDEFVNGTSVGRPWIVESIRGLVGIEVYSRDVTSTNVGYHSVPALKGSLATMEWHATDAGWSPRRWGGIGYARGYNWIQFFFPHAWLVAAFGVAPVYGSIRWWWRHAGWVRTRGLCRSCGYDLRATPHRCPECGTVPKVKA